MHKNTTNILKKYSLIGLNDWEHDNNQIAKFLNEVKVNNIVAMRAGATFIALVQVVGGAYDIRKDAHYSVSKIEYDWLIYRRPVRVLDWADNSIGQCYVLQGTLKICDLDRERLAMTSQTILKWYEKVCVNLKEKGE
ncbi:hypothetical protein HCD_00570 [Helicobacter cetorum MIT 99-5656]|uniref:Uncharacterized protein n=2 Tax=Helicobacter cetorum TaxID=138563 RepID=I0EQC7_HELCM|nr:hypothetical protein HCD_00570 [Helicobacter cetorum MIT 99-5656]